MSLKLRNFSTRDPSLRLRSLAPLGISARGSDAAQAPQAALRMTPPIDLAAIELWLQGAECAHAIYNEPVTLASSAAEMVHEYRRGEFVISTDRSRIDLDVVHKFLTNCYWAKGIPREVMARSIENSLCFGVYRGVDTKFPRLAEEARRGAPTPGADTKSPLLPKPGRSGAPAQVGFARVISDFATIAYLGDVFILEAYRGRGLSKWLMQCIMQHPAVQGLRRWILLTRDAHGLYSQFGFTPVKSPERYMELHSPSVYEARKRT